MADKKNFEAPAFTANADEKPPVRPVVTLLPATRPCTRKAVMADGSRGPSCTRWASCTSPHDRPVWSMVGRPSRSLTVFGRTMSLRLRVPSAHSRATLRHTAPISRSRLRTPASRV